MVVPDKYDTSSTSSTFYDKHTLQDKILRFASDWKTFDLDKISIQYNGKNTFYYYADITPFKWSNATFRDSLEESIVISSCIATLG